MLAKLLMWLWIRLGGGGDTVLAMLYATRIIAGKTTWAQVPAMLKEQVAEILRDAGVEVPGEAQA